MKSILISFLLMFCVIGSAQKQLNDYKYIIVPKRLAKFKKDNQYQTSTLVKHLLTKKGFTVVYEGDYPEDLANNVCLGLTTYLEDNSSMFMTKLIVRLKDCTMQDVLVSQEGRSRSKEYKPAYVEAITMACKSYDNLDYRYTQAVEDDTPVTISFKNDVKQLEENTTPVEAKEEVVEVTPIVNSVAEPVIETVNQINEAPISTNIKKEEIEGILYAQEIRNGYQLVDSTPSIRVKIYKSSMPNVYHAKSTNNVGVVYQTAGKWFFEYYSNDQRVVEELNIKF